MFHSASLKLGLERAVLSQNREQEEDSDGAKPVKTKSEREAQAKEIDELLKKGAYDVFRDEDDKEAEKFMETDIDQLLALSSKKVTYGATATDNLGSGLGSFSKASFVANTDEGEKDVDLDDPDFWSKAVGLEVPADTPEEVAAMLDDGVKRNRKQVQVYDPYAETAEAEKMKKERVALEKMLEKEEKERLKEEKKKKKKEAKEKKQRERDEKHPGKPKTFQVSGAIPKLKQTQDMKDPSRKLSRDGKPKKSKKSDRQRAQRRAENEDPVLERLKQAWEVPQRAKATAAAIRFGFDRFCKIRNESNLTSLPLQDLESFVRAYLYQLSLQVAVILLSRLSDNPDVNNLRPLFQEWLGQHSPIELDWMCDAVRSGMTMQLEVESRRRSLRMPVILAEPAYVAVLREGAAFRALRRIGFLVRLNRFVEDCVDSVLAELGHEELGKRGCPASELPSLDVDLKARYVTSEELSLAIGSRLGVITTRDPASWWDRSCDVGLVIGTFVHGLGNYEAMRNDFELPFAQKLRRVAKDDEACDVAAHVFRAAAHAARRVFDDALEATRVKAELEVQAAVAAAAKAALKREEDAALLRKGGAEAEVVAKHMPDTQVENAFEFDGTDSHFVTLPRMHSYVTEAVRKEAGSTALSLVNTKADIVPDTAKSGDDASDAQSDEEVTPGKVREHQRVPMPDARVLDHRLTVVLHEIENKMFGEELPDAEESNPDLWRKNDDVLTNIQVRRAGLALFVEDVEDRINEYSGVGLGGNQCGTSHRTLNDGSDFGFGSASPQLSQVAYGTDAPRYLRALGVPMNITRFAISGLVYAETSWVKRLLDIEHLQFYGEMDSNGNPIRSESGMPAAESNLSSSDRVLAAKLEKSTANGDSLVNPTAAATGSSDEAAQAPKKPSFAPVNPAERIPDVFRDNAQLRANICLAVLFYGIPSQSEATQPVNEELWRYYLEKCSGATSGPRSLFSSKRFRDVVVSLAPDVDVPDEESIYSYVETTLLPHCLHLCVNGNGPSTRGARGSQGEYETAFGVSLHPEPSESHPSPLPDPCLSLQEHSMEALAQANAILRRVRLLRSCHYISSGNVPLSVLQNLVQSKSFRVVDGLPVWWCPWKHDMALLVQAATEGLFSIVPKRTGHPVFGPESIQRSLQTSVLAGENPAVKRTPEEQIIQWSQRQSLKFPSLNQLERRLAFLCSRATVNVESEARYDSIPMFDHGGWPRN